MALNMKVMRFWWICRKANAFLDIVETCHGASLRVLWGYHSENWVEKQKKITFFCAGNKKSCIFAASKRDMD